MSTRVKIAEIRIGQTPAVLKAYGLGSCVAVALYDPEVRFGGLGHLLLPDRPKKNAPGSESKYVDAGILEIVDALVQAGASQERLVAKVVGGANMFETSYQTMVKGIGARNARSARATLATLGIPVLGEDVGGNRGRSVEFDLATGNMMVYCARDEKQISI